MKSAVLPLLAVGCLLAGGSAYCRADVAAEDAEWLRAQAIAAEHGEGVPKNIELAIELYCQAARHGDAQSQFNLGWIYANGRGTDRNDALAAYFFSLAARQGHMAAANMLRRVGQPLPEAPFCMVEPDTAKSGRKATGTDKLAPERQRIIDLVARLAPVYGVLPDLALAVIRAESNFDPNAVSEKNAQGLMQLIPETAERFNVRNPFDPEQNIHGGLAYLRWLLAYYRGEVRLVAAAYNAGEGSVDRFAGVPPFPETQDYVERIVREFSRERHPYEPSIVAPVAEPEKIRRPVVRGE